MRCVEKENVLFELFRRVSSHDSLCDFLLGRVNKRWSNPYTQPGIRLDLRADAPSIPATD